MKKIIVALLTVTLLVCSIVSCNFGDDNPDDVSTSNTADDETSGTVETTEDPLYAP